MPASHPSRAGSSPLDNSRKPHFLHISSLLGRCRQSGALSHTDEARNILHALAEALRLRGLSFRNVVHLTIHITQMGYLAGVLREITPHFAEGWHPTREVMQVRGLPLDAKVQISAKALTSREI